MYHRGECVRSCEALSMIRPIGRDRLRPFPR